MNDENLHIDKAKSTFKFYPEFSHNELVDECTFLFKGSDLKESDVVKQWLTVQLIRHPFYNFEDLVPILVEMRAAYEIELDGALSTWRRLIYLQTKNGILTFGDMKEIALCKIKMCIAAHPFLDIESEISKLVSEGVLLKTDQTSLLKFKENKISSLDKSNYVFTSYVSFFSAVREVRGAVSQSQSNESLLVNDHEKTDKSNWNPLRINTVKFLEFLESRYSNKAVKQFFQNFLVASIFFGMFYLVAVKMRFNSFTCSIIAIAASTWIITKMSRPILDDEDEQNRYESWGDSGIENMWFDATLTICISLMAGYGILYIINWVF